MDKTFPPAIAESSSSNAEETQTRRRILDRAKANLRRYGAGKTTVVDIARDLGMSHSNVYRFFRTKVELLDAVVEEWLIDEELFLADMAGRDEAAGQRMEALWLALLARKRLKHAEDAELVELYYRILAERPAAIARYLAASQAAIERIIADGVRAGEFAPLDVPEAARVVWYATRALIEPSFLYVAAPLWPTNEAHARNLIRTLVAGFANHAAPPALGSVAPDAPHAGAASDVR
jgi:AcrR family transcriptional regulator